VFRGSGGKKREGFSRRRQEMTLTQRDRKELWVGELLPLEL